VQFQKLLNVIIVGISGEMIDFDFTLDQQIEIYHIAILYKGEARKCYLGKAYLAGCILMGAALEGVLLATLNTVPQLISDAKGVPHKDGKIKPLEDWKLEELIRVAEYIGWLPTFLSSESKWNKINIPKGDYVRLVQQIRNLVHPIEYEIKFGRKKVTKKYLDACFDIVDSAVIHLSAIIKINLSELRKEKKRRGLN